MTVIDGANLMTAVTAAAAENCLSGDSYRWGEPADCCHCDGCCKLSRWGEKDPPVMAIASMSAEKYTLGESFKLGAKA